MQETLYPNGIGTYNQWFQAGGSTKWQNMIDNLDGTWVRYAPVGGRQSFSLGNVTSSGIGQVNWIKIYFRADENLPHAAVKPFTRVGGVNEDYAEQALTTDNPTDYWTAEQPTKPGGGAWTVEDLDAAEIGVLKMPEDPYTARVFEMELLFDFDVAGGSCFKTDIGIWLPPLIGLGANLLYREIASALRNLKIRPSKKEEFEAIKNALAVRPRFCFLGKVL